MPTTESTRRIVLTGVSRGLGRALAERFAEAGHTVLGCARSADAVAALAERLGAPHAFAAVDVADDAAVARWASGLIEVHGAPDFLINNAALINRNAPLWAVPAVEFDRLVRVNICGIANTIRHFVPSMIARGEGVIVNVTSYWGRSTAPEVAPYCASKFAVEGLTRALAQEIPKNLAAVALNPGVIDTDMLRSTFGDEAGKYLTPEAWSRAAAPFILGFGRDVNGKTQVVPGQ
jgi:NAD(P)-dependent dehydrogenase (short-subunit alcohol dehydrogenase family)